MAFLSFLPLTIFTFLCLGLVASHAAGEPSEVYWKTVLPYTPMPKALSDLVHPPEWVNMVAGKGKTFNFGDNKKVTVAFSYPFKKAGQVDSDRAHVGDNKAIPVLFKYRDPNGQKLLQDPNLKATKQVDPAHVGDNKEVTVSFTYKKPNSQKLLQDPNLKAIKQADPTHVGDNKEVTVSFSYKKPNGQKLLQDPNLKATTQVDHAHVGDNKGITLELFKYKPNGQKLLHDPNLKATKQVDSAHVGDKKEVTVTFSYKKPNSDEKTLQDNPDFKATAAALFFLEKSLQKGTQMKLFFTKSTTPVATFLPRELAKEIPFSSKKLPEIMKFFSLKPSSKEAEMMKKTIDTCEVEANIGEDKYCASSLESMIDFATSKLGKKVNAFSMEANRESDEMQEYTIVGVKKLGGGKSIACHSQNYAYALFYCHSTASTEAYSISLMGKNGARAKAVGVCHTDTKDWDADYIGFQVLNVKPGTVPICHLLPQGHVIWVPY